jgi:hypothetical protein
MMVVNSEGYVPLSQPRNASGLFAKKTLASHSWRHAPTRAASAFKPMLLSR